MGRARVVGVVVAATRMMARMVVSFMVGGWFVCLFVCFVLRAGKIVVSKFPFRFLEIPLPPGACLLYTSTRSIHGTRRRCNIVSERAEMLRLCATHHLMLVLKVWFYARNATHVSLSQSKTGVRTVSRSSQLVTQRHASSECRSTAWWTMASHSGHGLM
jgi:hypothetical protein